MRMKRKKIQSKEIPLRIRPLADAGDYAAWMEIEKSGKKNVQATRHW